MKTPQGVLHINPLTAHITPDAFEELTDYTQGIPVGFVEGDSWKMKTDNDKWWFCWCSHDERVTGMPTINYREINVVCST